MDVSMILDNWTPAMGYILMFGVSATIVGIGVIYYKIKNKK